MSDRIKDPLGVVDKWKEAGEPESREWADFKYGWGGVLLIVAAVAVVGSAAWLLLSPLFG